MCGWIFAIYVINTGCVFFMSELPPAQPRQLDQPSNVQCRTALSKCFDSDSDSDFEFSVDSEAEGQPLEQPQTVATATSTSQNSLFFENALTDSQWLEAASFDLSQRSPPLALQTIEPPPQIEWKDREATPTSTAKITLKRAKTPVMLSRKSRLDEAFAGSKRRRHTFHSFPSAPLVNNVATPEPTNTKSDARNFRREKTPLMKEKRISALSGGAKLRNDNKRRKSLGSDSSSISVLPNAVNETTVNIASKNMPDISDHELYALVASGAMDFGEEDFSQISSKTDPTTRQLWPEQQPPFESNHQQESLEALSKASNGFVTANHKRIEIQPEHLEFSRRLLDEDGQDTPLSPPHRGISSGPNPKTNKRASIVLGLSDLARNASSSLPSSVKGERSVLRAPHPMLQQIPENAPLNPPHPWKTNTDNLISYNPEPVLPENWIPPSNTHEKENSHSVQLVMDFDGIDVDDFAMDGGDDLGDIATNDVSNSRNLDEGPAETAEPFLGFRTGNFKKMPPVLQESRAKANRIFDGIDDSMKPNLSYKMEPQVAADLDKGAMISNDMQEGDGFWSGLENSNSFVSDPAPLMHNGAKTTNTSGGFKSGKGHSSPPPSIENIKFSENLLTSLDSKEIPPSFQTGFKTGKGRVLPKPSKESMRKSEAVLGDALSDETSGFLNGKERSLPQPSEESMRTSASRIIRRSR
ncbi:hypothetical protein BDR26DRAFT_22471 [Obelidium mucronatum]|nr:hypothetical protein BDR26DRAFT_22471 [Obelidium mucronatum]